MESKRGNIIIAEVIFLIVNILVFVILLLFVSEASSGALIYEKIYAKHIALSIDSSRPGTDLFIEFSKGLKIAKKNGIRGDALKNLVDIDTTKNLVSVDLGKQGKSTFVLFSDYIITSHFEGDYFVIRIREKFGGANE